MKASRTVQRALAALMVSACAWVGEAQPPAASTRSGAGATAPDAAQVAKGAQLSALGNCRVCHTAEGGKPFAGGRPLPTPFGTLYSTNITPDGDTGLGRWSRDDFRRAMHEGVDRGGHPLYPAFPYDHFTRVADEDVDALYAFIMTREPVSARAPGNRLVFPANVRAALTVWRWLYFRPGRFVPDAQRSAEWNRGAYLVEGLAHCGACHTPRNIAGAEKKREPFTGGDAEGWYAPALLAASPAPVRWSADALFAYLRHGFDAGHGLAAGPMAPVADSLSTVPESDVRAIVTYLTDLAGQAAAPAPHGAVEAAARRDFDGVGRHEPDRATEGNRASAATEDAGEIIFGGACATCHNSGDPPAARKPVPLALTSSVNAPDPRNALRIVLEGLRPGSEEAGAVMPGFAGALTDAQVVAVVQYLRARFSDRPRWTNVDETLRKLEQGTP
jgi:mono/diheme cytochrome c family protein